MNEARYGFTDQELQAVVPQLEAMKSVAADVLWRLHVKRTPELPDRNQGVLVWWHTNEWTEAELQDDMWFSEHRMMRLEHGQYWLPLPTFDPREVQA